MEVRIIGFEKPFGERVGALLEQEFREHPILKNYSMMVILVDGLLPKPSVEIVRELKEPFALASTLAGDINDIITDIIRFRLKGVRLVSEKLTFSLKRCRVISLRRNVTSKWVHFKKPPNRRRSHTLC